ncbi:MAG: alpha/beta hydrolase fold domain-containing protein [Mycobacterium sp.]|nr:alpha/beta hydrolase fold domain-containing protein [Mycobacterium sp.]
MTNTPSSAAPDTDVIVVGAGFAGLYLIHCLKAAGLSIRVFEAAPDLGGTWYWNRYPGARVDVPSLDYMYSFDPDWRDDWQWSEKYATQPEILRYLNHVADKHDLRRHITFDTRVESARWDDDESVWHVRTRHDPDITARFLVMATGCLSVPKEIDIDGIDNFIGDVLLTSRWPHEAVDFTGKRVAVVGTGSSAVQSIPMIAREARELVVFQRTPTFSIPAGNGPVPSDKLDLLTADEAAYRRAARMSQGGVPVERSQTFTASVSESERAARYEKIWRKGELLETLNVFADLMTNQDANEQFAEFARGKIRATVTDPATADALCPKGFPFGSKRPCLDTDYYATYNLPHVRLVDLRATPIRQVTATGIDTTDESFRFDAVVLATGFDAVTGAIAAVDIHGRRGLVLNEKWADGPSTYLGLMTAGFPNLFLITGPGSPSVLSNMLVSIEQHVEWLVDCITDLRRSGFEVIEPTESAEAGWMAHQADSAAITLFPKGDSWYVGANVPGKPQVFLPYPNGVDFYGAACAEVVERDYLGFARTGPAGSRCNDGVVRRLQPDAQMVLDQMAALNLPPLEAMTVGDARAFYALSRAALPPGPQVGSIVDGVLPGAGGDLAYRLYRPATPGPHPILVYFHGGGFVIGDVTTDGALCRDICTRSEAIVISVDYRHAPEHRFPAAVDDGFAAVRWIADNAAALGGEPGRLAVSGWSSGANIAAVVCRLVRDTGGPDVAVQLLLTPATDWAAMLPSHVENAAGYGLTTALVRWFGEHYVDPADRGDPRCSPLRATDLTDLPPAILVTAEFDPVRDEGAAYAAALESAGVPTRHIRARGHTHDSLTMVDLVVSGAQIRAEMADGLRDFLAVRPSAVA